MTVCGNLLWVAIGGKADMTYCSAYVRYMTQSAEIMA